MKHSTKIMKDSELQLRALSLEHFQSISASASGSENCDGDHLSDFDGDHHGDHHGDPENKRDVLEIDVVRIGCSQMK